MNADIPEGSLEHLRSVIPNIDKVYRRALSDSYEAFIDCLETDLQHAINELQKLRDCAHKNKWPEDDITTVLCGPLKGKSYDIEHDSHRNGHCDIVIKCRFHKHEWLGEAKIWDGVRYIEGGWNQLNKYATPTQNQNSGGLLIYVTKPNALSKLLKWKNHFDSKISHKSCEYEEGNLWFSSVHEHASTGLNYHVKHYFIALHHNA